MKSSLLKFTAMGMGLMMLAGCIVLSVYPFYNNKDLIFDPGLAGRWSKDGATNEFWEFSVVGGKSYVLFTGDGRDTNGFYGHLFQLKHHQFLDLITTNREEEFQMPMHLIAKVARQDDSLSLHFMDYGWLYSLLETNPAVLRHIVTPANPENTNDGSMTYLTADTKDLQAFLLRHVADANAFGSNSAMEFKRELQ